MIFLGSQDLSWQHTYTEQENGRAVQTHVYACGCVHTFAHGVVHALYSTSLYFMCVSMCVNISAKLDASEDENTHHCIDGNERSLNARAGHGDLLSDPNLPTWWLFTQMVQKKDYQVIIIGIKNLCMYVCMYVMSVCMCMCACVRILQ